MAEDPVEHREHVFLVLLVGGAGHQRGDFVEQRVSGSLDDSIRGDRRRAVIGMP